MSLKQLDHYFIQTEDIEGTAEFYEKVLGLLRGKRPPFGFPGAWMYLEGRPVVHIGPKGHNSNSHSTGPLGHIAFSGVDFKTQMKILEDLKVEAEALKIPEERQFQVFFQDPNGITIELDFPSDE